MAFVNERLTKEEMAEFAAKEIPNPGNEFFTLKPTKWTIDREKDVFLVWALQEREEPHDEHFVFVWKGAALPVKLRDHWVKGSPRTWELISFRVTEELATEEALETRKEILLSLKDALTVYGFDGNPNEPFNTINKNTKVEFKF